MPGSNFSSALAINDHGVAVGYWRQSSSWDRGAVWRDFAVSDLGTLGGDQSIATDINNFDLIVGRSLLPGNAISRAVIWEDQVIADLNDHIKPGSSWILRRARGINDAGQIVGRGEVDGETRAFMLTPITGMFALLAPIPGIAGQINEIQTVGGTPASDITFVYGFVDDQVQVPGCPGTFVDIRAPRGGGNAISDAWGVATLDAYIPAQARGRLVLIQAVEHAACRVSNRVDFEFE